MSTIQIVGWALVHSLWQGALIAAVLWCIRRAVASRAAGLRYVISVAALFLMPLLLAVTALRLRSDTRLFDNAFASGPLQVLVGWAPSLIQGSEPNSAAQRTSDNSNPSVIAGDQPAVVAPPAWTLSDALQTWRAELRPTLHRTMPWIVALWSLGVLLFALRMLGGLHAARRLVVTGVHPVAESWQLTLTRLTERLGIRRSVTMLASTLVMVPAVVGWLRPVVLIPASAFTGLTPQQLEILLAHELAHVRRHDYLVNVLQAVTESLLFYHPAMWWVSARVREEREYCCDDLAVAVSPSATAYAEALVGMEELRARHLGLALAASDGSLVARVRRLLQPADSNSELFPRWIAGAAVLTVVVLGAAGVGLASAAPVVESGMEINDLTAETTQDQQDKHDKKGEKERAAKDTLPVEPDTVIKHPNPSAPLAERVTWAHAQARRAGRERYMIAYSVAPMPWLQGKSIYVRRFTRYGFTGDGINIMGRITNVGGFEDFNVREVPLLRLVGGDPADVGVLLAFDGDNNAPVGASASSAALPVDFEGRTLIWLGQADDASSLTLVQELFRRARDREVKEDLTATIGLHATSALAVPPLIRILTSSEPDNIRDEAAEWLGRHPDPAALNALARAARSDRSLEVRKEAAESVGSVAIPAAADTLIALVGSLEHPDVRVEAVESLGQREEPAAVEALVRAAKGDRDERIQREAVETLGEIPNQQGVPALLELARSHPSANVRSEVMETIAEAAPPATAVEALLRATREDRSAQVQREAVESLGEIPDGSGIPALVEILRSHPSDEARQEAVETIGQAAEPAKAYEILEGIIQSDPSVNVQRKAVETLGEIKDPRAHQALLEVAERHPNAEVQHEAIEELGGPEAGPEVIDALGRVARSTKENSAREAVEELGEMQNPRALMIVEEVARKHPLESVRMEAIESYGEYAPPPQAIALFRELVRTERSGGARSEIMESLAEIRGGQGVPLLVEMARNHPDADVRASALHELSEIGDPKVREIVAQLLRKP